MAQIGFIGLGNMGAPMAQNLVAAGHEVHGFDTAPDICDRLGSSDLRLQESAEKAASGGQVVVLMLPNGEIAKAVARQVLGTMPAGGLLIDCSTIDVSASRDIHASAAASGILSLDAPVSGGVGGAAAGTLTFMVGGSIDAFAAGVGYFDIMGARAVHCGDGGAGQAAKICNNMLLGISMIGACEAFALADKLGLSQQALFDVVSTASGQCWSVNTYCPVPGVGPTSPADNAYQPGFAAGLMLKDLLLSQQAAAETGAVTQMGARATQLYQALADAGLAEKDFSAVITALDTLKDK